MTTPDGLRERAEALEQLSRSVHQVERVVTSRPKLIEVFEQALRSERRRALEEAAEACGGTGPDRPFTTACTYVEDQARGQMTAWLRARAAQEEA
jgi:hypothetical protein